MTCIISEELRYARTQFMLDLADESGKVTQEKFLAAVGGKQKLISNILWIVKRCGYVDLKQVRDGKKIAYWEVKVTGDIPAAPAVQVSPLDTKKGSKIKTAKPAKAKTVSAVKDVVKTPKEKAAKSDEKIRAANLAKMKKVSAKLAKKKAAKSRKIDRLADEVEREFGSTGEIATSYNIDPSWDSVEGLDIQKLVA